MLANVTKHMLALSAIALFMLLGTTSAASSATCLFCQRSDLQATLLSSFSYCATTDQCLQDQWNYINRPCSIGWSRGNSLDAVSSCSAVVATCNSFVATSAAAGQFFNYTQTLAVGQYCILNVDTSNFVARIVIDDATSVGLQKIGYKIGTTLTQPQGSVQQYIVFNGDTSGTVTFTLSYSQAVILSAIAATVISFVSLI